MFDSTLWRTRNFRLLFASSTATNLGDGVVAVAIPWLATLLTRDPLLIGLVAAARQVPWLLFALPAGVLTDRFDHVRALVAADLARVGVAAALLALALLAPPGTGAAMLLAALAFALGTAEVLRDNTAQSFLPAVVPKDRLEDANGLLWSAEQVAGQFAGPPLAGLLIGVAVALPFGLQAAMLAGAVALTLRMALPPARKAVPQPFGPALREGLVFLWRHPVLRRMALALGAFNFAASIFWALVVLYAQEVLGMGPAAYGVMMAAVAGGGLAGSLIGPAVLRRTGPKAGLVIGVAGFALAAATLGFTRSPWAAGTAMAVEAFTALLWNIATVSYRQRHIPAPLLGRVNAAYRFFGTGPSAFGSLTGGAIVALGAPLGPVAALQLPYAICLGAAVLILAYITLRLRMD
ncbi:MFS transporter [Rhodobacter sp. Har01]|uniref:MFS transporter n=1 Tax=Rhodobacter sp. Har01 TaxID=2883999 RepID=UPI001D074AD0|nr:MFS transporter [Rhodobacter sp. Har01]MCB6177789.1 MFS transporter [Rhodobacter sp. Har01]